MDSEQFHQAVRDRVDELVNKSLVEDAFGVGADLTRVPEAKARIVINQKERIDRLSCMKQKLRANLNNAAKEFAEAHQAGPFMDVVGGLQNAMDALVTGDVQGDRLVATWTMCRSEVKDYLLKKKWPSYVYGLCLQDGTVFYVGKGTGARVLMHEVEAEAGCQSDKCSLIREIKNQLRYTIFLSCADGDFAGGFEAKMLLAHKDRLKNIAKGSDKLAERMFQPVYPMDASVSNALKSMASDLTGSYRDNLLSMLSLVRKDSRVYGSMSKENRDWYFGEALELL